MVRVLTEETIKAHDFSSERALDRQSGKPRLSGMA
jgi:hypothetical protein